MQIFCKLFVNKKPSEAMIDSGASLSLIDVTIISSMRKQI